MTRAILVYVAMMLTAAFLLLGTSVNGEEGPARRVQARTLLMDVGIARPAGEFERLSRDNHGRWRLERSETGHAVDGQFLSTPTDLGPDATEVSLDWTEQWTAPLRYEKHPGNPIYGPGKSGAWDKWTNGVSVVPTADGKTYRMYYSGGETGIGFAEASVDAPLTWKEHPSSPVFKPRFDNWEGGKINQPRVVKVTDKHWRMYYTGWGFPGPGQPAVPGSRWAMGLAESFDGGTSWKRWQDEPCMDRGGPDSPDGGGACVPMVLKVGERWMMWYTAVRVTRGVNKIHLCLAMSVDGLHWEKHPDNPVLADDFSNRRDRSVLSRCYVRHDEGVFRMWFSFSTNQNYRIHYAESLDGIHWELAPIAPVLNAGPSAWDSQRVEYPEVQIAPPTAPDAGAFRLWFCGNRYGSVGLARGVVETGVTLAIRSGGTANPEAGWGDWAEMKRGQVVAARRYTQVRARLWSKNRELSPALNRLVIISR